MKTARRLSFRTATLLAFVCTITAVSAADSLYSRWTNGPPSDPNFFPIAVWLQSPRNAARYQAAGINTYVGLWRGPTDEQLRMLKEANMRVICSQNSFALSNRDNPLIIGWMHGDEPDNAQARPGGKGYGPPILPQTIVSNYHRIQSKDPSRPILLNLGQGVAWDNYIGRGVRRNHPEDYPEYLQGCDIGSFDIYPAVHSDAPISGKLEYVAKGVDRLVHWAGTNRIVWNCIEASRISNTNTKPTAGQIRSEVWMSLIHGSRGLIYFVHQFKPTFQEASLLEDESLLKGVTALNAQIHELAPVLNSPTIPDAVRVTGADAQNLSTMVKQQGGGTYLFAVNMQNQHVEPTFELRNHTSGLVEVLGEGKKLDLSQGRLKDSFAPYAVHLYRF